MRRRVLCAGAALALVTALAPRPARAFEVRTTSSGKDVGWISSSVSMAVDPSLVQGIYASMDAVNDSAKAWRSVTIAPQIQVTRAAGGDQIGAIGKNVVFFAPDGYPPAGRALAITVLSYEQDTGTIVDADVVVNGAYRFAVLDPHARPSASSAQIANDSDSGSSGTFIESAQPPGTFDLTHVVAHELGHVLGLRDEPTDDLALMYRYTLASDASHRTPAIDDVAGIAAIYREGKGKGCAMTRSRVRDLAPLAALLVLAVALRRRRAALFVAAAACLLFAAPQIARGNDEPARAHARARVVRADTDASAHLWSTHVGFAVEECRIARCPAPRDVVMWGGAHDGIVQQIGESPPLAVGDAVELSFEGTETRFLRALRSAF